MMRFTLQHRMIGPLLAGACCLVLSTIADFARASGSPAGGARGAPAAAAEAEVESDAPTRGVSLGEFRIRAFHPVEAKRCTVIFNLHAVVSSKNSADFKALLENRRHKVRDQVIVSTRLVPLADFDQPKLDDFRRRILLRLRRTMPELKIDDVYVSDFQLEVRGI